MGKSGTINKYAKNRKWLGMCSGLRNCEALDWFEDTADRNMDVKVTSNEALEGNNQCVIGNLRMILVIMEQRLG